MFHCSIHGAYGDDVMWCCCVCGVFFVVGKCPRWKRWHEINEKKFKFGKRLEKNTQQYPDAPWDKEYLNLHLAWIYETCRNKYSLNGAWACGMLGKWMGETSGGTTKLPGLDHSNLAAAEAEATPRSWIVGSLLRRDQTAGDFWQQKTTLKLP